MTTEKFVKALAQCGLDYEKAWTEDMAQLAESNALLANFSAEDFRYAIAEGKVYDRTSGAAADGSAKEVEAA